MEEAKGRNRKEDGRKGTDDSEDRGRGTREREGMREEEEREGEGSRSSSTLRVYLETLCVMVQRGENTEVGTWCPLRPVPIPSTAITYNNDGLMEPVGDLTLARKREE